MTPNPWVLLGALAAFVASVTGAFFYGQNVGAEDERVEWQARENVEITAANRKILDLTEAARAQESLHAIELNAISTKYQEDLQNEKATRDRVVADLRNGSRVLRIPVTRTVETCGGEAGTASASTSGRDGEARADIHPAAAEFLVGLASEADAVVRQLAACQAMILQDRRMQ